MKWEIQDIKESLISSEVSFVYRDCGLREVYLFRKANMEITQMCWITKRAVMQEASMTVFNPRALIMLILN